MNKLYIALLVVAGLGLSAALERPSNVPSKISPIKFYPGKTYVYNFFGREWNMIPTVGDQSSGISFNCKLILQPISDKQIVMKLDEADVKQLSTRIVSLVDDYKMNAGHESDKLQVDIYQTELSKRVIFDYVDGQVVKFETEDGDAEWSVNFKKTILASLQMKVNSGKSQNCMSGVGQSENLFCVFEESSIGECETQYELHDGNKHSVDGSSLEFNVTKSYNFANCKPSPKLNSGFDNQQMRLDVERVEYESIEVVPMPDTIVSKTDKTNPWIHGATDSKNMSVIKKIFWMQTIKYHGEADTFVSRSQQKIKLLGIVKEGAFFDGKPTELRSPLREPRATYTSLKPTLSEQSMKYSQAYIEHNERAVRQSSDLSSRLVEQGSVLSNRRVHSPSWFSLISGRQSDDKSFIERSLVKITDPKKLMKSVENLLESISAGIVEEENSQTHQIGQKLVQLINTLPLLPNDNLLQLFVKLDEAAKRETVSQVEGNTNARVSRKIFVDSLPLTGSVHIVDLLEQLIVNQSISPLEVVEICETLGAELRYVDAPVIDSLLRIVSTISTKPDRKDVLPTLATCSIAAGKLVKRAAQLQGQHSLQPTATGVSRNSRNQLSRKYNNEVPTPNSLYDKLVKVNPETHVDTQVTRDEQIQRNNRVTGRSVRGYIQQLEQLLDEAREVPNKIAFVEALAHTGSVHAIPILKSIIADKKCGLQITPISSESGEKDCNFMRTVAAYSLAHIIRVGDEERRQIVNILLPVFDNQREQTDVRIAAFTTIAIASKLDSHLLERIFFFGWRDANKQVDSFVASSMESLVELSIPELGESRAAALRYKLMSLSSDYFSPKESYSSLLAGDHYDTAKQSALCWSKHNIISSDDRSNFASYFSLARKQIAKPGTGAAAKPEKRVYLNRLEQGTVSSESLASIASDFVAGSDLLTAVARYLYDSSDNIVSAYVAAREELISSIRDNYLPDDMEFEWKQSIANDGQLKQIFAQLLNGKQHSANEKLNLVMFTKLFEQTRYMPIGDRQSLEKIAKMYEQQARAAATELSAGKQLHFVKLMMPNSDVHVLNSAFGLPLVLSYRNPIVLSFKLDGTKNHEPASANNAEPQPTVDRQLFVSVTTKVLFSTYRCLLVLDQPTALVYGVQTEKSAQLLAPFEIRVSKKEPNCYTSKVRISAAPALNKKLLWTRNVGRTFIGRVELDKSPLDANWLGEEHKIRPISIVLSNVDSKRNEAQDALAGLSPNTWLSAADQVVGMLDASRAAGYEPIEKPTFKVAKSFKAKSWPIEIIVKARGDDLALASPPQQDGQSHQHVQSGPSATLLHIVDSLTSASAADFESYVEPRLKEGEQALSADDLVSFSFEVNDNYIPRSLFKNISSDSASWFSRKFAQAA